MKSFKQFLTESVALLEMNILGSEAVDEYVKNVIKDKSTVVRNNDKVKAWLESNLKNYVAKNETFFVEFSKNELIEGKWIDHLKSIVGYGNDLRELSSLKKRNANKTNYEWLTRKTEDAEVSIFNVSAECAALNPRGNPRNETVPQIDLSPATIDKCTNANAALVAFTADVYHAIDYLASNEAPDNISRMSVIDAISNSTRWHEQLTKKVKKDVEDEGSKIIHRYEDGYSWRLLNCQGLRYEGNEMGHCVGGGAYHNAVQSGQSLIYSLRDEANKPHVTIEVRTGKTPDKNQVIQIQGKQNTVPSKYLRYIVSFLNSGNYGKPFRNLSNRFDYLGLAYFMYKGQPEYVIVNDIPDGYVVKGDLNMRQMPQFKMAKNMTVLGSLYLAPWTRNEDIPAGLTVRRNLILNRNITQLPKDLKVERGYVIPNDSPIKQSDLPKGLKMKSSPDTWK